MDFKKIGISTALIGALCYFAGNSSFLAVIALLIFVLVTGMEENTKKNAVQAVILCVFFSIIYTILSACSGCYLDLVEQIYTAFDNYNVYNVLIKLNIFSGLRTIISILEFVVMILGFTGALKGKFVKFPITGKLAEKYANADVKLSITKTNE